MNYKKNDSRDSGIESIKIVAMGLVVLSHVTQSLRWENAYMVSNDYVIDLTLATKDVSHFILSLLGNFSYVSNLIFFVASAWFLIESSKCNLKKWFFLLFEVWTISVFILIIIFFVRSGNVPLVLCIKSVFPTIFSNNWYISCYLVFYLICPLLNRFINSLSKVSLLRVCLAMTAIYLFVNSFANGTLFSTELVEWVTIYFVVAYIKLYSISFTKNIKLNVTLLIISSALFVGLIVILNALGLHMQFFNNKLYYFARQCNPLLVIMAICTFDVAMNIHFHSAIINYLSSLTLIVYVLHENILIRKLYRPLLWMHIYDAYGYDHIVLWVFALAMGILVLSFLIALLYDKTLRKVVRKISDNVFVFIRTRYDRFEEVVLTKLIDKL